MRNLKRVLTMVMAIAMMMSLMVVGAGATSFKDDKDIVNKKAVEKMVSLNIINGRDTGNFDPKATVTRAEMAKMITIALNGGNDPKLDSSSVVTSTFTDTKGHWAEGYIEYSVNMGILAGLGDGTFAPDQGVTSTQAAKMLLVALGYDAEYEKFVGLTWALSTNKYAQMKGLYDEIQGMDVNAAMTRDNAAQMLSNFCEATMVKYSFGISGGTGGDITGVKQAVDMTYFNGGTEYAETVLHKYYKLVEVNGIMTSVNYDSKKKEFGHTIDSTTYYSATDFSELIGMDVILMFRDKNNNNAYNRGDDSVYDVNADESIVIAEGVMDDFGDYVVGKNTVKFNGTVYDVENDKDGVVPAFHAYNGSAAGKLAVTSSSDLTGKVDGVNLTTGGAYKVKLIDNDGDDKIDRIMVTPFTVNKVTYVGTSSSTFSVAGSVQAKDFVTYDDMAKDDIVAYYNKANAVQGVDTIEKLDIETGTITGVKGADSNKSYQIEGKWFTADSSMSSSLNVNDEIEYVAVGSVIYYGKVVDYGSTTKDILAVYDFGESETGFGNNKTYKVKFMTSDGNKKTEVVTKVDNKKVTGFTADNAVNKKDNTIVIGQMYSYKIVDGEYELTTISDTNKAGHDDARTKAQSNTTLAYKESSEQLGEKTLADDAKVFVVDTDGRAIKLYNGKEMKNFGENLYGSYTWLANSDNGLERVKIATIFSDNSLPTITKGSNYAYLTDDAYSSTKDNVNYVNYTIWTSEGGEDLIPMEVAEKDATSYSNFKKGDLITYDNAGDGLIKNVSVLDTTDAPYGAVTGTGSKVVSINKTEYKIDDDTAVIYINQAEKKPAKGAIQNAIQSGDNTYLDNVRYLKVNSTLKVLLVDVDNSMMANSGVMNGSKFEADMTKAFNDNDNVVLNDSTYKNTKEITIPSKKTLTVNALTTGANIIVEDGGKLIVKGKLNADANAITVKANATVEVTGDASFAANTAINGNMTVAGQITGGNNLTLGGSSTLTSTYKHDTNTAIDSITANGTVTVAGNIGTITANTGTIKVAGNVDTIKANSGTINVTKNVTTEITANSNVINVTGTVASIKENVGTITVTGTIAKIATIGNTAGKIVANGDITLIESNVANSTIDANGTITTLKANEGTINIVKTIGTLTDNTGTINVKADMTFATLPTTGTVNVDAGKTLTLTGQLTNGIAKTIKGSTNAKLSLKVASAELGVSSVLFDKEAKQITGATAAESTFLWTTVVGTTNGWVLD